MMFRSLSGSRADYHYLRLVVVSDFDEWKVLVVGPDVSIHGARQFSLAKAQEHALTIAKTFINDRRHEDLPVLPEVEWTDTGASDWLKWQA
jgi:hypothetical protein